MTKAESVALSGRPEGPWNGRVFKLDNELNYERDSSYGPVNVRVYVYRQQGHTFALHCDNHWGDSILWMDGTRIGNYEINYEDLWPAIDRLAPVPEMSHHEEGQWQHFLHLSDRENDNIQPTTIGNCVHCGERVWMHSDPGECSHGVAHGQCMSDNGCPIA